LARAGAVVVENAQYLRGSLLNAERMWLHRGELGRLAGPDEDGPLAQPQHDGAGQDGEPVSPRVDAQPGGHLPGNPQLRDRPARGAPVRDSSQVVMPRASSRSGLITTSASSARSRARPSAASRSSWSSSASTCMRATDRRAGRPGRQGRAHLADRGPDSHRERRGGAPPPGEGDVRDRLVLTF